MSGFINKKRRFLDFKLTEDGRSQMASGDIRFRYFTFSDRSIVYHSKKAIDGQKISDSEFSYLPFEVTTDPGLQINPEYFLSSKLTYQNPIDNFFSNIRTQQTTISSLSSRQFLTEKTLTNALDSDKSSFVFDEISVRSNYDFYDEVISRKYPTVVTLNENIFNIFNVKEDQRFNHKLKYKKLSPINKSGLQVVPDQDNAVDFTKSIFKTFDVKNSIRNSDSREEVISKSVSKLESIKNTDVYHLSYKLNSAFLKSNDIFLFEMHEIKNNKLSKLSYVNLGKIFDKNKNRFISVFLAGKFIVDRSLEEKFNEENRTGGRKSIVNYKFVNMFTIVIE